MYTCRPYNSAKERYMSCVMTTTGEHELEAMSLRIVIDCNTLQPTATHCKHTAGVAQATCHVPFHGD